MQYKQNHVYIDILIYSWDIYIYIRKSSFTKISNDQISIFVYFCIRIYIFNLYNKYRTPSRKVAHEQHQHPVFYPHFIKSHRIRCAFSFIPYPSNPLRNISPVFKARFRGFSRVCVSSAFVPRGNPREFSWNSRIISGARDGVWTNFIHELRFQRFFLRKQEIRLARERAFLLV